MPSDLEGKGNPVFPFDKTWLGGCSVHGPLSCACVCEPQSPVFVYRLAACPEELFGQSLDKNQWFLCDAGALPPENLRASWGLF